MRMETRVLRKMLGACDDTAWPVPATTLPDLFEAQVARDPDAVALIFGTQSLDYGELNARANRLAHHLIGLGVGPESLVGVCLDRSFDLVTALLAILKAGAVYLPFDPELPDARLTRMLANSAPALVIATTTSRKRLPQTVESLALDDATVHQWLDRQPDHDPTDADRTHPLDGRHPAYVIYTSGSTGSPKGVVLTQDTLLNLMAWHDLEGSAGRRSVHVAGF